MTWRQRAEKHIKDTWTWTDQIYLRARAFTSTSGRAPSGWRHHVKSFVSPLKMEEHLASDAVVSTCCVGKSVSMQRISVQQEMSATAEVYNFCTLSLKLLQPS